ncbi:MAG: hypothetical protein KBT87_05990, partial [Gammaproteobacteria bacterium]|nr:hypothetical protein [Gammaproteobacteria bacterium]MBQ0774205.1 hypothetical protein [Gammaproteobacteria bacterium]
FARKFAMNLKKGHFKSHKPLYSAAPSQLSAHLVRGCLQAIFPEQTRSSRVSKKSFRLCPEIRDESNKRAASKATGPSVARHHLKFLLTLWEAACRRSFPSKRAATA